MKTFGIIGAMEEEVALLKKLIQVSEEKTLAGLAFIKGTYAGKNIVIVRSGIGKVNAAICTQLLIDYFNPDYIINVGVAGAIAKGLGVGDVVISSDALQHDMNVQALGDPIGTIPRMECSIFKADEHLIAVAREAVAALPSATHSILGRVVSGDQFIADAKTKQWLSDFFDAACAEMEGAAIAHACFLNQKPFIILRCISDAADQSANMSFLEFSLIAAKLSSEIVKTMLEMV